jgi:two-component system CheB/CheR fusion protein
MAPDSGLAFVLVQHLAADRNSILDELLGRHTTMPVQVAVDGDVVLADHVYVIPPDRYLTIHDGCLRLAQAKGRARALRAIDMFFASLAEDQCERAACIVLAGSGDDGSFGLRAVKEHGGLAIAQAEVGAGGYRAMPDHAFETGLLDAMLPIDEMPGFLLNYAQYLERVLPANLQNQTAHDMTAYFGEMLRHVQQRTGHDFSGYKSNTLLRRMQRRMSILKVESPEDYVKRLAAEPAESTLLLRDFLIGVTQFFRDPKAFGTLRRLLSPLIAACDHENPFRVWVPGCATGEEVYSLAILLKETMIAAGSTAALQVFGSDIDDVAIGVARAGRYHLSALAAVAPASRRRWFVEREGMMEPVRELRDLCVFAKHSLVNDPPFSRMHLISCRNLLIYFGNDLQDMVLQTFHYALRQDGFLFLGLSEGLGRSQKLFTVADKKYRIFRHSGLRGAPMMRPRQEFQALPYIAEHERPPPREDWLARAVARAMARHSPVHIIVDATHQVTRFSAGAIADFLDPAPGFASLGLFNLLKSALHAPVRQALMQAAQTSHLAVLHTAFNGPESGAEDVTVIVEPLFPPGQSGDEGEIAEAPFFVVAFSRGNYLIAGSTVPLAGDAEPARNRYAVSISQIESLNEELRLTLDEHQAINEELRSANEELEASREEMQSVNEELQTVNTELNSKNDMLISLNNDFRNLLDSTHIATLFLDRGKRVKSFTPNIAELFALRSIDIGRPIGDLNMRLDYATLDRDFETVLATLAVVEQEVNSLGEAPRAFVMRMRPYKRADESVDGVVLTFVDITERKQREISMQFQAHHDQLTGLPNRMMFHSALDKALLKNDGQTMAVCLLLLDLDRFKNINDAFGHAVGDQLLQQVSVGLRGCVQADDIVCRLGGDEFAVLQTASLSADHSIALADRILTEISMPYEIEGAIMHVEVSIGIAFYENTAGDAETMMRAADIALYDAKAHAGNNRKIYFEGMQNSLQDRRDHEADLRNAIQRNELILMYQPLVRLADREITGAEVLIRWQHGRRGLLVPADFISLAEDTGLIVPIGNWVLHEACKQAARWQKPLSVAVNLSSVQFSDDALVAKVQAALQMAGLPAARLVVEITESVLLQNTEKNQEVLSALRQLGVAISMDDFGTGYSSLSYLRNFKIDKIKIDKVFAQEVDTQAQAGVIVKAVVALGDGLGIAVCAEGVETEAQMLALQGLGVKEVQGFLLYPPMHAEDFALLLRGI